MILQNKLFLCVLIFCAKLFSQENNKDVCVAILNSNNSYEQVQRSIDSITQLRELSITDESYIYHSYAKFLFNNNKRNESYKYLYKAIELREKNQENDLISLKQSLCNLGLYYGRSGKLYKSINVFKELIDLPNEDRLRMKAYSELISLYSKIGDFEKSTNLFEKTTNYHIENKDYKSLYKNYMRISKVYALKGYKLNSKKIIYYLNKTDSLGRFTEIDKKDEAIINLRLGIVYEEINQKEKALEYYNKALVNNEALKDSVSISMINNNIGDLYLYDSSLEKAIESLQKSLLFAGDDIKSKSLTYSTFGAYYSGIKDFKEAKLYFEKAIQLLVFDNETDMYVNPTVDELTLKPNKLRLFDFIHQKASYWKGRFDNEKQNEFLNNALIDYKLADQLLDVIRFDSTEKTSKLFWREKGASLYMKAVEVCYLLNDMESAYFFMEKNKALLLLEELSDQQAKVLSNLPQQLIERDFALKQKIIETEEATTSNKTDILFELKRSYEQFKDSLATNYPAYSKLKKSLPVLNLQNHKTNFINKDSATLQYIINDTQAYGLAITKESTTLYHINDGVILQNEIGELTTQLQHPFNTQTEVAAYVKNSNSIFEKLIPNSILEKLKRKKITIAADGIIQNIPFEALISDIENQNSYLIKYNEINYVYSFSYLLFNSKKIRNPEHTFLGLAPERFKDKSLAVLPNSIYEVTSINSIFSDKTFVKEEATKLNFKTNFENYKIVHLATHSGSSNTEKPWLAFSDDKVNLNEIYATQNQADLVVLSACKTSQGELKTGEGVMSLARGFFFSGTNSVVSTLWNINDKTTQEIMYSFYTNIKDGQTKSKALHESKLAYLSSNEGSMASPFYWSSFVLIGDAGIVPIDDKLNLPILLLLFVIVLIVLGVAFKKRRKK
ncbi:MAG: CHAT domain-containing protein [Flavobacteriaceae bacterium]|nr:CHAT domain-containing protein [Flavobacteriaceae bacterium]